MIRPCPVPEHHAYDDQTGKDGDEDAGRSVTNDNRFVMVDDANVTKHCGSPS